jgi:hypothetical protein
MGKTHGRIVIVAYQPLPEKEKELEALLKKHLPILRGESLATDRVPIVMKSSSDIYIEVFEWKSKAAIEKAHSNPEVLKLWAEFSKCCTYEPACKAQEVYNLFSEFEAVELS